MSKVTSICGTPRGAGGMPTSSKRPVHAHQALVVLGRREDLAASGRNGRIARQDLRHDAALRLHADRERNHVEQQHVLGLTPEHARLDRGTDGDDLVGIHAAIRLALEDLLNLGDHPRHASHAAHEHDLIEVGRLESGIFEGEAARRLQPLDQGCRQLLEQLAGQHLHQVLRALFVRTQEREIHVGLVGRRQLLLAALRGLLEALHRHRVFARVHAELIPEPVREVIHQNLVEVLASQIGVAVRREHLEHAAADLQDRDVEGATAEVEDHDLLALGLVEPVRQRRGGRLVDDPEHVEPRDAARILGRLTLRVVEVGGDRDHDVLDLLAEVVLSSLAHALEHLGGDLLGTAELVLDLDPGVAVLRRGDLEGRDLGEALHVGVVEAAADEPLHRVDRVVGIGSSLSLGDLADQLLGRRVERDDRRRRSAPLGVRDHHGLVPVDHRDAAVRGSEVDSDDPAQVPLSSRRQSPMRFDPDSAPARHDDQCGPEQPILQEVSLLEHLHDRSGGLLIARSLADRFVNVGVELFALRRHLLDPALVEGLHQGAVGELDTLQ
jgi:hypothetical protein